VPVAKFSATPSIQTSNKPVIGFTELKIKSKFLLQDNSASTSAQPSTTATPLVEKEPIAFTDVELTNERIQHAIVAFAEQKSKTGNKQLYATLTSSKITLQNTTIIIELNNEVQKEMLVGIKQDMLDELRTLLSNKQTQLDIKVSAVANEIKAYKPTDKFKLLAEKNPALLELKKRFDLDIEY
jgi:DNA polymerase-3 subunit gamma/tau